MENSSDQCGVLCLSVRSSDWMMWISYGSKLTVDLVKWGKGTVLNAQASGFHSFVSLVRERSCYRAPTKPHENPHLRVNTRSNIDI